MCSIKDFVGNCDNCSDDRRTLLRQIQRTRLQKLKYYHLKERGKLVTLKSTKNSVQLKVLNDWTEMSLMTSLLKEQNRLQNNRSRHSFVLWMAVFKNQISLDQHLLQGSCEYKLEKGPLKDQAKVLYAQKLSNNVHHCPDMQAVLLENACTTDLSAKEM
ncbi:unnamed protein product [Mytilus coruscus]|uniref:Uncharacterized protein n=1 Tax=Mytilus coruscus TaxID=42192 RepID=A0A6J8BLR5_MYTCO|nr:unnamed protein product [Mytilus coruscus]